MAMKFFNSLGRQLQEFKALDNKEVDLYTCGPTVYNHVHIGNLRAYIAADILKRALTANGYNVNWVMNITDVDDKTIANTIKEFGPKANVENLKTFSQKYFETFLADLKKINVNQRDISFVKVTEKIADIQEYIVKLITKGYAYKAEDGSTYFSIEKYQNEFKDYGVLVGPKFLEGKKIGARVKVDEYDKENLSDFALWKAHGADDAEIFWDHPILGPGRPGWHIECTLINYFKFPRGTDIHTGGVDLMFPHHTNEIAQAQPIYRPFVNYWLHSEHIQVSGSKMAKSLGNVFLLKDLIAEDISSGLALRYLYLQSHYRSKINVTKESLQAAKNGYENLVKEVAALKKQAKASAEADAATMQKFNTAIANDLNTPEALAVLHETLKSDLNDQQKLASIYKIDEVFGLDLENAESAEGQALKPAALPAELAQLLARRATAKTNKNFELADNLRQKIEARGYALKDTADGTEIFKK